MRMFGRKEREMQELNMTSLPDLIFTVLFFFILITHMRDVPPKVEYVVPEGTELVKLVPKSAVVNIYIGRPLPDKHSHMHDGMHIQLNDKCATIADIGDFVEAERKKMSADDRNKMTIAIKADRQVNMKLISDIKQELRSVGATRISYAAAQRGNQPGN